MQSEMTFAKLDSERDSDRITFTKHAEMRRRGKRNSLRNAGILNAVRPKHQKDGILQMIDLPRL
jgi:hypothetical protein